MGWSDLALFSKEFPLSQFVFIFTSEDSHKATEAACTHKVEAANWKEAYYSAYALCPEKEGDILWYAAEIFDTGSYDITSLVENWIEDQCCGNAEDNQSSHYSEDFDIQF